MAARAYWKGYLRLSLVSCPIALYPATTDREKIHFHQLNKDTGNRVRYLKVDAETGKELDKDRIVKGYELHKGEYVEISPEELETIALDSTRMIEIDRFVPREEIDELYFANPYYIVPNGDVGAQAFAVIRDTMDNERMVALGRVVLTSREHIIALERRGNGIMGSTLRYPYEVRNENDYFDDIPKERVTKDMRELAAHIVKTKTGHFKPQEFRDRYERALKDLVRKKEKGQKIEPPVQNTKSNVINLMDALRRSAKGETSRRSTHKGHRGHARTSKKKRRGPAHKKAS